MNIDGNLVALQQYEQEIEESEKRYEYFLEEVESTLGDDIDYIIKQFDSIAKDNDIDESLIEYLQNR